ncbi:Hcp family type VI secretion system effector [Pseudacidovorax intermedius]|uniref:Hcp family type VI secretion system effector n=1 Tax=Pseudacidovorax intermedius TaxID=433924 RepID=UPI0005B978E5|nr:type VI secretion system tube protein Hcp [Pseudacidovorax intermedius]
MASDIFLKIDGITGESQDSKHLGEIDITSWSWAVHQEGRMMGGSGGGAPKATAHDMELIHNIDRASPGLMTACFAGRRFAQAVLTLRKAGGLPLDFMKITLSDVLITKVSPCGGGGGHFEEIHLSFAKIRQEYLMQNASGGSAGTVVGSFDIKNNAVA